MYKVYLNGNRICPECSALMDLVETYNELIFHCRDCGKRYRIRGEENEKEMILEDI